MKAKLKITEIPESSCPYCATKLTHASNFSEGVSPSPGDVQICLECLRAVRFTESMMLRKMSEEEYRALPGDLRREINKLIMHIACMKAGLKPQDMQGIRRKRGLN
jgi:hypothetical protein